MTPFIGGPAGRRPLVPQVQVQVQPGPTAVESPRSQKLLQMPLMGASPGPAPPAEVRALVPDLIRCSSPSAASGCLATRLKATRAGVDGCNTASVQKMAPQHHPHQLLDFASTVCTFTVVLLLQLQTAE